MKMTREIAALLAGSAFALVLAAGPAAADDEMTWSYATAHVGTCTVGQTCGQPGGVRTLGRESFTATNSDYNNASVYQDDYQHLTSSNYGLAFASAQAGEGVLGLPVLKAYALGGFTNVAGVATTSVDFAAAHAIQGYTNTSEAALVIPLNAFQGLVDYISVGGAIGGRVGATLAVTTSAILDPTVSSQYFSPGMGSSAGGQWTGSCGSTGALAMGSASVSPVGVPNTKQYLGLSATSCTGSDTYLLAPGQSFYVWATLGVLRSGFGVTDASNTFNVTIAPDYQALVETELAPSLALADGGNLAIVTGVVPEPSTWALIIAGFGSAGAMLRRQRRVLHS